MTPSSIAGQGLAVRQRLTVAAPPERAWRVFTEDMGTWWPLGDKHIGAQPAATAVVEPREGGRWFERAADGTECDWGRVLTWDPPHRLVLAWQISAQWAHDPSLVTEVEVRFTPAEEGTRVELEHRGLEAYGEAAERMRDLFGSDGGWLGILRDFAAAL